MSISDYSSEVFTKPTSKRSIFGSLDRSGLRKYLSSSKISLEIPEEVQALRKVKYQNVCLSESSTEEEMGYGKESHVDSEDSGLFKEGYFLKRPSGRLGKNEVDQEVNEWKQAAEKKMEELTSEYNKGSKKKVSFSIPLGLEMNGKVKNDMPDEDSTVLSKSMLSSKVGTEDELDLQRNEEFMREVQRVLRSKKNPGTLTKRSLHEEYGRQLSKKMNAVCKWAQHQLIPTADSDQKSLPQNENPSNTETGAGGDNTSGAVNGIFEQLSQMVLKNKISKRSKAAQTRKQILKRAEEKREKLVDLSKHSEIEEDQIEKPIANNPKTKKVRFFDDYTEPGPSASPNNVGSKIKESEEIVGEMFQDDNRIMVYAETNKRENRRVKKVEMYLAGSSKPESNSSSEGGENHEILTAEEEKYVFDGLAGEFLRGLRTQCLEQGKMSPNDSKLLNFLVMKYIDRGELAVIDEMLSASVEDCKIKIPPYENAKDREQYFLRMLIWKYIKRGMRTILEDRIAWIYYRVEALKNKSLENLDAEDKSLKDRDVEKLVNAFGSSGGNSSLNRLVEELVQECLRGNVNLKEEEIADVRVKIRDTIVCKFARIYLEGTVPGSSTIKDADGTNEDVTESNEKPGNGSRSQKGVEKFDINGRIFEVQWKTADPGVGDESPESDDQRFATEEQPKEPFCNFEITKQQASLKKGNSVGRLQDKFWNKLQLCITKSSGKRGRFCTPVSKRAISLIGGSKVTPKNYLTANTKQASTVEDLKRRLREDNIRWLTQQKNKLWEARNKEAKSIDQFTMSLPKRMEQIIQRRNRLQKELIERESSKLERSGRRKRP